MALNYKSISVTTTNASPTFIYSCGVTSTIIKSILVHNDAGVDRSMTLNLAKSGSSSYKVIAKIGEVNQLAVDQILTEPLVMNNGDVLQYQANGANVMLTMNYVENTTSFVGHSVQELTDWSSTNPTDGQIPVWDNATGQYVPTTSGATLTDTSGLPEQSSGTEPFNRYMKNLDSLTALTDGSANSPEDVLSGTPSNVNFVVENNTLSPAPPQKVTFDQIIQALMVSPLTEIANDPNNNLSLATFTGSGGLGDFNDDGEVGSGDLLDFLTWFGNSWAGSNSALFQESKMQFSDGLATMLNDTTWTTLQFDSADYTVTAGTQNVTVDHTTNYSVKLASQTSPYLLKDVLNKYVELKTQSGQLAYVTTGMASQRITIRATIDLYDSSDVALGSQGVFEWKEQSFGEAGTHLWVQPGIKDITNELIATECGVTDGMENASFHSVVITLQAKTNSGNATIDLRTPMITLKQL